MESESFVRTIAMDFEQANQAYNTWVKNLLAINQKFGLAHGYVIGELAHNWEGQAALEFLAAYNPIHDTLSAQLEQFMEMARVFRRQIDEFETMQSQLAGPY
jgi:uncharacterized protein YukE